ncbi:MAG: hypothetical protein ABJD24_05335 [Acidimicrobiales bacterium]
MTRPVSSVPRFVAAAVLLSSGLAGMAPAASGASPTAHLVLIDQSPTVGPEGPFVLRLRLEGTAAPDLEYAIDVHPAVTDRVGLRSALAGTPLKTTLNRKPIVTPIASAVADSTGDFTLTLKITEQRVPTGSDALRITKVGVYPVTIVLRDGESTPVDTVQTAMVRVAAPPAVRPFRVAFAMDLTGPQLFNADLRVHLDQATLDDVARTTAALAANPTMPVTVSPAPELLDALAHAEDPRAQALLTDLDHALAGHQVLANTYVPIDAPAFLRHNLAGELDTQLIAGETALRDALPSTQPDRRTWLPSGPLDEPTLGRLQTLGSNQLVIAADALEPADGDAANAFRPVEVLTSGGAIPTAVIDADLQRALSLDLPATVAPIRLYLELAFVALQHPDVEEGTVIVPPDGVTLSAGFLTQFLGLVQRTSLIATVTVDDYFRLTRPAVDAEGEPVVRTLRSVTTDSLGGSYPSEIYLLRLDALSTAAMVSSQADMPRRIEQLVLLADRLGLSDTDRRPYLTNAHAPLEAVKNLVAVGDQGTVTLTSGSDEIPYRITNSSTEPVSVMIRLSSTKLAFPDSTTAGRLDLVKTLVPGANDFTVPVTTRARATFPMVIEIRTPDGKELLASSKVTIRSTALSGVGIALTIGAALTLVVWWLRHAYNRRRAARVQARSGQSGGPTGGLADEPAAATAASTSLTSP